MHHNASLGPLGRGAPPQRGGVEHVAGVEVKYNQRWMELGGAGIFRPEVTLPVGVKHPVLAWGLGLERLAMMRLGLKDIRELYMSDIEWLRRMPARL